MSDEQQALVDSLDRLLRKMATPERVRQAEPLGHDAELWAALDDVGVVDMAVPQSAGGWGASMVDLALVAEQIGRFAAPAPVVDAQVGARLLAGAGGRVAMESLEQIMDRGQLVTLALHPIGGDGFMNMVPAGAVADGVIGRDDADLRLIPLEQENRRIVRNVASAPLADLDVSSPGAVLASGSMARELHEVSVDEWLTLTAAANVGLASTALTLACSYASDRRAFDAPIGSFQAISHPLADAATALDGARLLTQKAAWCLDTGAARSRELAAMAFAFAVRSAEEATYTALHVHGGYGFMLEYDVQLFYRRARGWPRVWGDADLAVRRAAEARYGAFEEVAR